MGRIYRVPFSGTLTTAGGNSDLIEILPADDKPCRLVGMRIGQTSEVKDAEEEGLEFSLIHMAATVTSGSGGSAVTPVKNWSGEVAAGFTAECNNTTVATTSGTSTTMEYIGWNVRNSPFETFWFDEKLAAVALQGEALLVRSNTTPADDILFSVTFFVEELP